MSRLVDDWIEGYLEYTENSEPPTLYKYWVACSVIASALRRKCYVPWGHETFYPNLYIVLVGPSGKCRKGTAMGIGKDFLKGLDIKVSADAVTRAALVEDLKRAETMGMEGEQEIDIAANLTIHSQELTVFLGYNNPQLIMDMTDWYDCADLWENKTKTQGTEEISGVWVNLIGATTPHLVRTAFPETGIAGGLASRIIFVYEETKSKIVPAPFLNQEERVLGKNLAEDLLKIQKLQGAWGFTEAFFERYSEWYIENEKNPPDLGPKLRGYVNRRQVHLLKTSMILSAAHLDFDRTDESGEVVKRLTKHDFDRALERLRQTEENMPFAFAGKGQSDDSELLQKLMRVIRSEEEITQRRLLKAFITDLDGRDHLLQLMDMIKATDYCREIVRGSQTIYKHTPKEYEAYKEAEGEE